MTARERFRASVSKIGWDLESYSIGVAGPDGEDLTIDVGISGGGSADRLLLVSSGLHGVEGFFGSAAQLAMLERWQPSELRPIKCVLIHGLNPYGFAHTRRFDENNVDPNRSFRLADDRFEGAANGYVKLNSLLNPRRPPFPLDPFPVQAAWLVARHGLQILVASDCFWSVSATPKDFSTEAPSRLGCRRFWS